MFIIQATGFLNNLMSFYNFFIRNKTDGSTLRVSPFSKITDKAGKNLVANVNLMDNNTTAYNTVNYLQLPL